MAICCALAAAFHLGLTEYATQTTVTYCDGGVAKTRGPVSEPIIPGPGIISDTFCMSPAKSGRRAIAAFYDRTGLFPRDYVSRIVALCLGVAVPVILVLSAVFAALKNRRSASRALSITVLGAFGSLTLTMWVAEMAVEIAHTSVRYLFNYTWPLVIPAAFFSGAFWLSRKRFPKEPA